MFKRWCTTHTHNVSHVLMDGGKLSVPCDTLHDFYDTYIDAVASGKKVYVVEQKTETYNFFVDIDNKSEDALDIEDIRNICTIICERVRRHSQAECLVSVARPRPCGTLMKTGVHMNWYGLVVDQASAIALREHILVALTNHIPDKNWNDIIDSSVYGSATRMTKGSGLRMPWSHKKSKHDACSGLGCTECTHGKIDQGYYLPLFIYTKQPMSTLVCVDQDPSVRLLMMASIRTNAPVNVTVESPTVRVMEGSFSKDQAKNEIHDQKLKSMIETFVREHMEGQGRAYITKIFKHKDTYLVSTTSKYCENVKKGHNSNHIWFIISGKMIAQKCFCRCETIHGRRDGFCKDFCGRQHTLSQAILDALYPNACTVHACPKIKPFVEKPSVQQSMVSPPLEAFIRFAFTKTHDVHVVNIVRDKKRFNVLTTSHYCETINGNHDDNAMSYVIQGDIITQKCPVCKKCTSRKHRLTPNVLKTLKQ